MNGLGFFIWQLDTIQDWYTPAQLAQLLGKAGVRWVSWKLAEGIYRYNQVGGNDKILIEYMQELEAVGVYSGGWSYNYPEKPGTQAGIIAERIAKFTNNLAHFDHWMVDIEGEWKRPNLGPAIDSLLYLDINKSFQVSFCSYRYPKLHSPLNFSRFLKHETVKFNAPQVYWLGAHNPVEQLNESFKQYAALTSKPFVPIGAAWGQVVGDTYWEPSADDLKAFVAHCKAQKWYTYGFWSLDWIIKKQRLDMLEAISGQPSTPPPPPPPQLPASVVVQVQGANIRSAPNLSPHSDVGALDKGKTLKVTGKTGEFYKVETYVSEKVVK